MNARHPTRGRTSQGRLRALDRYILVRESALLEDGLFVDVGFGEGAVTTIDSATAFARGSLQIVGLDTDETRVEAARRSFEHARFEVGGFEEIPRGASIIRVMNVLRAYPAELLGSAHASIGSALRDGGLAIDGTSDPEGDVLSAHLFRKRGDLLVREALLFHSTFAKGFAPLQFRDWLPRDLRRRVKPGEWIHALLGEWTEQWKRQRSEDPRESFARTARAWAEADQSVDASLSDDGFLLWKPAGGVPR